MITVTRLNGQRFVLNADLIRTVEENPDTIVTLTTGDRYMIREDARAVVAKVVEYGRLLRRLAPVSEEAAGGFERNGSA